MYEFKLRKHWQKPTTTRLTTKTNTSNVEKIKNRRKQNFDDEANNKQLGKNYTQRSNLDSKYLSVTSTVFKYSDFFLFSSTLFKVQLDFVKPE